MSDLPPLAGAPTPEARSSSDAISSPAVPTASLPGPVAAALPGPLAVGPALDGAPALRTIGLAELFLGFASAGLSGFGGVLPFARRMIVEQRRWMNEREFIEILSLGQFLPGPNIVNVSVMIGARYQGVLGSVVACSGLMLPPFCITIVLGALYQRYGHVPIGEHVFTGVTAAASGLLLGTAGKLARPLLRQPVALLFLLLAFVGIAFVRWPLILVLLGLAPFSVWAFWPRKPKDSAPKSDPPPAGTADARTS
jgi:chromate transporter